jgi:hypothetical protein
MPSRRDSSSLRNGRGVALAVAVLLLAAQSLATAHIHFKDFRAGAEQTRVAETFCPLCLFHFHSPRNPGAAPLVVRPAVAQRPVVIDADAELIAAPSLLLFSRAPPIAL